MTLLADVGAVSGFSAVCVAGGRAVFSCFGGSGMTGFIFGGASVTGDVPVAGAGAGRRRHAAVFAGLGPVPEKEARG